VGHVDLADDLAAIRAAREPGGPSLRLMADYNQSLSVAEARRRIHRLDDEDLCWIEEPTRAQDLVGHAEIAREMRTPIQIGENWVSPEEVAEGVRLAASDLVMFSAMKIGNVTGWLRAAALAHAHGLPVSSHFFPEISAHLLAASPGSYWLEFLDLASPVLASPACIEDGHVAASAGAGSGIEWNEGAVARFACADA
jgi:mandelate racemase